MHKGPLVLAFSAALAPWAVSAPAKLQVKALQSGPDSPPAGTVPKNPNPKAPAATNHLKAGSVPVDSPSLWEADSRRGHPRQARFPTGAPSGLVEPSGHPRAEASLHKGPLGLVFSAPLAPREVSAPAKAQVESSKKRPETGPRRYGASNSKPEGPSRNEPPEGPPSREAASGRGPAPRAIFCGPALPARSLRRNACPGPLKNDFQRVPLLGFRLTRVPLLGFRFQRVGPPSGS